MMLRSIALGAFLTTAAALASTGVMAQPIGPGGDDAGSMPPIHRDLPPPDGEMHPPMMCVLDVPPDVPGPHQCRTHPGRPGSPCHCGDVPAEGHREPAD